MTRKYEIAYIAGRKVLAVAAGLIVAATLAGCSTADDPPQPDRPEPAMLAVEVTDMGYDAQDTRTAEQGWRTEFTAGDRIGLYGITSGSVTIENLCLIRGANGKWATETGEPLYHKDGTVYFAYYPWQADMNGRIDAAASSSERFFSPLEAGWIPAVDQGTHDDYTAWDLMTGAGIVDRVQADGTRPLILSMWHSMSIAAVELPSSSRYTTPDGFAYITPSEAHFAWGGASCKPYRTEGVYRILFNPNEPKEVSGYYLWGGVKRYFAFTPDVTRAAYRFYRVDGGLTDGGERALKPGDLYYADGSILPVETAAVMEPGTAPRGCIGIVFQTDPSRISEAEKALFAARGKTLHGVAMSVKAVGGGKIYPWYNNTSLSSADTYTRDESIVDPGYPDYFLPNVHADTYEGAYELSDKDINGYFNTEVIRVRRAEDLAAGYYPAFRAVTDFASEAGGPAANVFTSGWYMPSIGQWLDFLRNVGGFSLNTTDNFAGYDDRDFYWTDHGDMPGLLNQAMSAIPDQDKIVCEPIVEWVWTSTAVASDRARAVGMDRFGNVNCPFNRKNVYFRVRCAIAF